MLQFHRKPIFPARLGGPLLNRRAKNILIGICNWLQHDVGHARRRCQCNYIHICPTTASLQDVEYLPWSPIRLVWLVQKLAGCCTWILNSIYKDLEAFGKIALKLKQRFTGTQALELHITYEHLKCSTLWPQKCASMRALQSQASMHLIPLSCHACMTGNSYASIPANYSNKCQKLMRPDQQHKVNIR